jgi:hypothetical protein
MLQRVDMCLERLDDFQQALRTPAIGMTLFSQKLQVFSGEILWNLKRGSPGLEKLQFLSTKVMGKS